MINIISKTYKVDDFVRSFGEQLELFFSKYFESKSKTPRQDENLGQVFISPILAKFMISLLRVKYALFLVHTGVFPLKRNSWL